MTCQIYEFPFCKRTFPRQSRPFLCMHHFGKRIAGRTDLQEFTVIGSSATLSLKLKSWKRSRKQTSSYNKLLQSFIVFLLVLVDLQSFRAQSGLVPSESVFARVRPPWRARHAPPAMILPCGIHARLGIRLNDPAARL